MRLDNNKSDLT